MVRVKIPQKTLIRLFYAKIITPKNYRNLAQKSKVIEQAINKLQHIASLIDRIMLKSHYEETL